MEPQWLTDLKRQAVEGERIRAQMWAGRRFSHNSADGDTDPDWCPSLAVHFNPEAGKRFLREQQRGIETARRYAGQGRIQGPIVNSDDPALVAMTATEGALAAAFQKGRK